jgi:hypothetical protein
MASPSGRSVRSSSTRVTWLGVAVLRLDWGCWLAMACRNASAPPEPCPRRGTYTVLGPPQGAMASTHAAA